MICIYTERTTCPFGRDMDVCKCNDEDVTWIEVAYSDEGWAIPLDVPHEDATDEP